MFYVYVYLDTRKQGDYNYGEYHFDYEPFYVGKGCNGRDRSHILENSGNIINKHFKRRIKKIIKEIKREPIINRYFENLSEQEAFDIEIKMIMNIGRFDLHKGPLLNMTNGGEGSSNRIITQETKNKISKSNTGNIAWNKGLTKETDNRVKKYSEKRKEQIYSDEIKKKMSISAKRRCESIEYKKKFIKLMTSKEIVEKNRQTRIENGSVKNEKNPKWRNIDLEKLEELYFQGYSVDDISNYFKVLRKVIDKRLKILNLKKRKRNEVRQTGTLQSK